MSQTSPFTPVRLALGLLIVIALGVTATTLVRGQQRQQVLDVLWAELEPQPLVNCELERVGRGLDGGYVVCGNLLDRAQAVYSYGISGEDSFGCALSARLGVEVHQYDCFNLTRPPGCDDAQPVFHEECVGAAAETIDGHPFDTVPSQIARTGHDGERVLVKMDIEGAEIPSLLATPPETLAHVDQLVLEIHDVWTPELIDLVRHLKSTFHIADVHWNNFTCTRNLEPFPARTGELLLVNKALDEVDPDGRLAFPNPVWQPNHPEAPDCQVAWSASL